MIGKQIRNLTFVILVTVQGICISGCQKEVVKETVDATVVCAETVKPFTEKQAAAARYSAVVKPRVQVDVAFKGSGYVDSIAKARGEDGQLRTLEEGDTVKRGQLLASIRARDSQIRIQAQRAAIVESRASQENARALLEESEAGLEQATQEFARAERLFNADSLTQPDFEAAKTRVKLAHAKVNQARAQISTTKAAEGRINAGLSEAQLALSDCYLISPISGVVVERKVEVGSLVTQGTVGMTLADSNNVKVSFAVPDVELKNLKEGKIIEIFAEADPHSRFSGRITEIAPAADAQSRTFDVEVTVPNYDHRLKMGMVVALSVASSTISRNLLVVPLSAVVRSNTDRSKYAVFTVNDQSGKTTAEERIVQLGDTFGALIAVNEGLKNGDRVVTVGSTRIVNGQGIRVADQ